MPDTHNLIKNTVITWFIFVLIAIASYVRFANDFLGPDNDDVMRLVQVRDWLGGQGWFDLQQYRLGPEGGTLMHWSRLVDAPIAGLIWLFSLIFTAEQAEIYAVMAWPLITAIFVIVAFILSVKSIVGKDGVVIGAIAALAFLIGNGKFNIGAIDHHNVQLAIYALLIFILIEPGKNWKLHVLGGFLCALAIAIGAETTPLIAVICGIVAVSWAWFGGKTYRRPTRAFALSMASSLTVIFFVTIPSSRYTEVVCDTLSFGFYTLGLAGSGLLFLAAATLSYKSRMIRFLALGGIGLVTAILAKVIAPHCLQSPLANLDPLLVEVWLNNVTEAQSFLAQWQTKPLSIFGYYAVPTLAIILCIFRLISHDKPDVYIKLLVIIGFAFAISLVQIRGSIFANLAAMIPMAILVHELRMKSRLDPKNSKIAFAFIITTFLSMPVVWAAMGAGVSMLTDENKQEVATGGSSKGSTDDEINSCITREALIPLNELPTGAVVAPSNMGASILRYSDHRVLAAPYHRNQFGMLTEIRASLAKPEDAHQIYKDAGVSILVFCKTDPQVSISKRRAPDGLYAQLSEGTIPDFLIPQNILNSDEMMVFLVKAEAQ